MHSQRPNLPFRQPKFAFGDGRLRAQSRPSQPAKSDQLVQPNGQPQRVTGKVVRYDKKKRGQKHYWVEWDKAKLRSAPQSMSVDEIRRLRTV